MNRTRRAFTLLELLAAVALLVILGSMLFEIFGQSSKVVSLANARQEVFQYARAALEFIERELTGAFTSVDAQPGDFVRGLKVYNTWSMGADCKKRDDSQGIFLSTGIMARDTRETIGGNPNPFFGQDVNCARVAYYINKGPVDPADPLFDKLDQSAVYRSEMYRLSDEFPEEGTRFVRNCLFFNILVMSRYDDEKPNEFQAMNWDSDVARDITIPKAGGGTTTVSRRRGLPQGVFVRMRLTDASHATLYKWDAAKTTWTIPGPGGEDASAKEDPVVQTFSQIVYFGRRSD